MVRALLEGRKTQTRRLMRPQPIGGTARRMIMADDVQAKWQDVHDARELCPYGVPGDRLWVRETWRPIPAHGCGAPGGVCDCADVTVRYAADGKEIFKSEYEQAAEWNWPQAANKGNVPAIHMPRWASRITLELTDVRVQRLQDISEEEASAEGAEECDFCGGSGLSRTSADGQCEIFSECSKPDFQRTRFANMWNFINRKRAPWDSNPFVWALTFKVIP
jgi:hypothetical protein